MDGQVDFTLHVRISRLLLRDRTGFAAVGVKGGNARLMVSVLDGVNFGAKNCVYRRYCKAFCGVDASLSHHVFDCCRALTNQLDSKESVYRPQSGGEGMRG